MSTGFPRQEHWRGLPFPSPRDLPNPRIEPVSPTLAGGFFTTVPPTWGENSEKGRRWPGRGWRGEGELAGTRSSVCSDTALHTSMIRFSITSNAQTLLVEGSTIPVCLRLFGGDGSQKVGLLVLKPGKAWANQDELVNLLVFSLSFLKINFYWSIVALQCCISFYCTAEWISHI